MTRADLPYPLPAGGGAVRLAFVGQRTYFAQHAQPEPAAGVRPAFFDFRAGGDVAPLLEDLAAFDPHVVVAFRPETLPPGALAAVPAPVVGVVTEPLPADGRPPHPNLDFNLARLREVRREDLDRAICCDVRGWDAAAALVPAWRCLPLPVADWAYRAPAPPRRPPRAVFVGHPTMHRETTLLPLKHELDLPHYAHALMDLELREALAAADVGLALHDDVAIAAFPPNVLLHLAAGHLVIAERLDPPYGLEPGLDYLEAADADDFRHLVHEVHRRPDAYDRVRIRGHHASRQHRASVVWPRLVADLFADLETFGTLRASRPHAAQASPGS